MQANELSGKIRNLSVWNRALTKKEIRLIWLSNNDFSYTKMLKIKLRWVFSDTINYIKNMKTRKH